MKLLTRSHSLDFIKILWYFQRKFEDFLNKRYGRIPVFQHFKLPQNNPNGFRPDDSCFQQEDLLVLNAYFVTRGIAHPTCFCNSSKTWNLRMDPKQCFFVNDCCGIIVMPIMGARRASHFSVTDALLTGDPRGSPVNNTFLCFGRHLLWLAQGLQIWNAKRNALKSFLCAFPNTQAGLWHLGLTTGNPGIHAIGSWAGLGT